MADEEIRNEFKVGETATKLRALEDEISRLRAKLAALERERDGLRHAVSNYLIVTGPCEHSESDPPGFCDDPTCNYCELERVMHPDALRSEKAP